jgi:3-deoxy-D-manno-octulosonate 8-phosphate phosphatase KdsC-like HAD superfamily phosphatase
VADKFQFSVAPEKLWQAINPWSFYNQGAQLGFVNINLGQTNHPEVEQKVLDEVGSYGRQLGRIGDALEVLIDRFDRKGLTAAEKDALAILKGQLAAVRKVKAGTRGGG